MNNEIKIEKNADGRFVVVVIENGKVIATRTFVKRETAEDFARLYTETE